MTQMEFRTFAAVQRTHQSYWELTREGVAQAADIVAELLRHDPGRTITYGDIVKAKMEIDGDTVPDKLARTYADQVDAITEARTAIRDSLSDRDIFHLRSIDANGAPCIRGGDPNGFVLAASAAGIVDDDAQAQMTIAKLDAIASRRRLFDQLDDEGLARLKAISSEAKGLLLGTTVGA